MKVVVYADESGTHDGSEFSLLVGWIAYEHVWNEFIPAWQAVLDKYKVQYFHFTEFAHSSFVKRNPTHKSKHKYESDAYKKLSIQQMDGLLYDCSLLLTNRNLQFEISILERQKFFEDKIKPVKAHPQDVYEKNPEIYLVKNFFERVTKRILEVWGTSYDGVSFIFDKRSDSDWRKSIKAERNDFVKWGWQLEEIQYKSTMEALPIQAADMLAYKAVQITRNVTKGKKLTKPSILDGIISKRMIPPKGWTHRG